MIYTTRTPLRVSFFGGGTDYPEYFDRHPGAVLGMAINQYIYISAVKPGGVQPYRYRLSYSQLEMVDRIDDIQHPVMRETLRHFEIKDPLDINILSDMPANTGLGSSSAFTVGMLNMLYQFQGKTMTKMDLARKAIFIERDVLKENVGVQDQLHAAFGGINRYDFIDGRIRVSPLLMANENIEALNSSLYLIFSGEKRYASKIVLKQLEVTKDRSIDKKLDHLLKLADQAVDVLETLPADKMLPELGRMLHESWMTKKSLTSSVSTAMVDAVYEAAMSNGALGGKLCGAGGGGFLLMVIQPDQLEAVRKAVHPQPVIPIEVDNDGSIRI